MVEHQRIMSCSGKRCEIQYAQVEYDQALVASSQSTVSRCVERVFRDVLELDDRRISYSVLLVARRAYRNVVPV